ncbi:MAG: hypothetical protein KGL43_00220 [Burkholderiales bacterium]|nr:hypothetical protein [Burkholderiales bacterium]
MSRYCADCSAWLGADSPRYMTRCRSCFIAHKRAEADDLRNEVERLRAENSRLRLAPATAKPAIEPSMLRRLIQLCHPDRHAGSDAATVATTWLLSLRNGAAQ